jgi:predicted RNA-binding protein with PIN domain
MPYLVDGNNLLGRVLGKAPRGEGERSALVRELAERLRSTRARVTLVFDGAAPHGAASKSLGPLAVRFAGSRPADDVIAESVQRAAAPRDWIAVTDDRALAERVRSAGGRVSSVTDFWARFGSAAASGEGATPAQSLEDWLEYFSDERNRKL